MTNPIHIVLATLFLMLTGLPGNVYATTHPVAAVKLTNGSLFLLASDGTVLAVNLSMTSGSVVARFNSKTPGIVADLAYGIVDGHSSLFIASSYSTGHSIVGLVQEFTTDGHLLASWTTGHVVEGLTFDSLSQTVYFSSGDSPEIYAINPKTKSAPWYIAEVSGASKLGSLTIDPATHQMYVSDITQGKVYVLSLANHQVVCVGQVGTPQALLLDNDGRTLFVADNSRRQVVSFALGSLPATPTNVTSRNSFRSPTGLAWGDPSHLIVADQDAGLVYLVDSASGRILYSVALP